MEDPTGERGAAKVVDDRVVIAPFIRLYKRAESSAVTRKAKEEEVPQDAAADDEGIHLHQAARQFVDITRSNSSNEQTSCCGDTARRTESHHAPLRYIR